MLSKLKNIFSENLYQKTNVLTYILLPFSIIFLLIITLRRFLFLAELKKSRSLDVPVIVVGNITVGGTGKTPFIIFLAKMLKEQGFNVGIIRRGYGSEKIKHPRFVNTTSTPQEVGDESLLIAKHVDCPIVVSPDRVSAGLTLLKETPCDVILSDDGLQHYALHRDIEIVVVDSDRQFGNGFYLPAGPLREPISRLKEVDFIIFNGSKMLDNLCKNNNCFKMNLRPLQLRSVKDGVTTININELKTKTIHAVSGIGHNERFFKTLQKLQLSIIEHAFPDHYEYCFKDIDFNSNDFVIMTEKDAVKCREFADHRHWFLPVETSVENEFNTELLKLLKWHIKKGRKSL